MKHSTRTITEVAADFYGVTSAEIISKKRTMPLSAQRQMTMLIIKELTRSPLTEIGRFFSRDHATVIHSIRAAKARMDVYPEARKEYVSLIGLLKAPSLKSLWLEYQLMERVKK